jgi:hypothetical protein
MYSGKRFPQTLFLTIVFGFYLASVKFCPRCLDLQVHEFEMGPEFRNSVAQNCGILIRSYDQAANVSRNKTE